MILALARSLMLDGSEMQWLEALDGAGEPIGVLVAGGGRATIALRKCRDRALDGLSFLCDVTTIQQDFPQGEEDEGADDTG
jgi:hypothetical protein